MHTHTKKKVKDEKTGREKKKKLLFSSVPKRLIHDSKYCYTKATERGGGETRPTLMLEVSDTHEVPGVGTTWKSREVLGKKKPLRSLGTREYSFEDEVPPSCPSFFP